MNTHTHTYKSHPYGEKLLELERIWKNKPRYSEKDTHKKQPRSNNKQTKATYTNWSEKMSHTSGKIKSKSVVVANDERNREENRVAKKKTQTQWNWMQRNGINDALEPYLTLAHK